MGEIADSMIINFEDQEEEFAYREAPKLEQPKDYL